jgi:hypothetical protein
METTLEFDEVFTKWFRQLFRELDRVSEAEAMEYRYIYIYNYSQLPPVRPAHATFKFDKRRITPRKNVSDGQIVTLRISGMMEHEQLRSAFAAAGLSPKFEVDLVAKLVFEIWDDDGTQETNIDPCVDIFHSPIKPIFRNKAGRLIPRLSRETAEMLMPALIWSLLYDTGERPAVLN